ncbi:hypothetical protein EJ04DRAFT_271261 [Polyplosphaeria fusca]|uniref:Uncharacterized protein n=1 Tax=Polyplosphaeria fusca TaxID=682080 RepID=A0A9P4QYT9_9PLEO|nr:hypothetical protein EJ04DRAFT_271261 [Polyplosphaeria fusca]
MFHPFIHLTKTSLVHNNSPLHPEARGTHAPYAREHGVQGGEPARLEPASICRHLCRYADTAIECLVRVGMCGMLGSELRVEIVVLVLNLLGASDGQTRQALGARDGDGRISAPSGLLHWGPGWCAFRKISSECSPFKRRGSLLQGSIYVSVLGSSGNRKND